MTLPDNFEDFRNAVRDYLTGNSRPTKFGTAYERRYMDEVRKRKEEKHGLPDEVQHRMKYEPSRITPSMTDRTIRQWINPGGRAVGPPQMGAVYEWDSGHMGHSYWCRVAGPEDAPQMVELLPEQLEPRVKAPDEVIGRDGVEFIGHLAQPVFAALQARWNDDETDDADAS